MNMENLSFFYAFIWGALVILVLAPENLNFLFHGRVKI